MTEKKGPYRMGECSTRGCLAIGTCHYCPHLPDELSSAQAAEVIKRYGSPAVTEIKRFESPVVTEMPSRFEYETEQLQDIRHDLRRAMGKLYDLERTVDRPRPLTDAARHLDQAVDYLTDAIGDGS